MSKLRKTSKMSSLSSLKLTKSSSQRQHVAELEAKIRNMLSSNMKDSASNVTLRSVTDFQSPVTSVVSRQKSITSVAPFVGKVVLPETCAPATAIPVIKDLDKVHPIKLSWSKVDVWVKPSMSAPKRSVKEYSPTDMRHIIQSSLCLF